MKASFPGSFAVAAVFVLMLVPAGATPQAAATTVPSALPTPQVIAPSLAFPTNMAIAPDGRIFFNEKDSGQIRIIKDGQLLPVPFARLHVVPNGETGLLGLALDPNFAKQPYVYAYYSDANDQHNHLVRFRANGDVAAGAPQNLLTLLPVGNAYHNGGDITFGPDGKLYVVTGEIHEQDRAQDPTDLGGKVLRLNADGSVPSDNPFAAGNPAYSMGHRNSFGLCFDPATHDLWETENGPSSDDEINRIVAGGNYGWPVQLGPGGEPAFIDPVIDFPQVIVPTGCTFWNGKLYFGDFGGHLNEVDDPYGGNPQSREVATFPSGITDLQTGPNGELYVVTATAIERLVNAVTPGPSGSATPSPLDRDPGGAKPPTDNGAPAGIIGGIVILIVVIVGGLVFRSIQRKDARRALAEKSKKNGR